MKQIAQSITNCYKNIIAHSWLKIGMLFSVILLGGAAAQAQQINYLVSVPGAPAGATDIHLVFTPTGGSINNVMAVNPAAQTITLNSPVAPNGWTATFAAVAANTVYQATFNAIPGVDTASGGTVTGTWSPGGQPIAGATVTSNGPVPALPAWALASLILVVVTAGFFYLKQKKYKTVG